MRRHALMLVSALAASGALLRPSPAGARELSGVTMPDTLDVHGQHLVLNGMGVRKKTFVKVYVGGLYLTQPARDAGAIVAASAAKAVRMHFVRDVEKAQLVEAFREGFADNAAQQSAA